MSKRDELKPRRVQVRLVWRLILCLCGQFTLLLFLAVYLIFSLQKVSRYAPIVRVEEIQLESLDTTPPLLGALDAERRAYAHGGDPRDLALYQETRQAVQAGLAALETPLLLPDKDELRRRELIRRWITTIGDVSTAQPPAAASSIPQLRIRNTFTATPPPSPPPDPLAEASRALLDPINALSAEGRIQLERKLAALQAQEEAEATSRVNTMWIGVGSVTFITILLQAMLANSIIGPIQALGGVVRRLQAGDYTVRARIRSGDEIESLGETFNAMAENILHNQRSLQETNARLEERVAEKTEQIRQSLAEIGEKNEKLNEAARLKDEFLATLSHELRTPLTPVISCAHLLAEDDALGPEQRRNVAAIDRNARALSRMIDELLDLSAVMNRKLRLARETMEMNEWTRAALEPMRAAGEKKGLTFIFVPAPAPVEMEIDPPRLAQVLTNLINNAIKFTRPGGSIAVRLEADEDELRITVTDTGLGLDRDELERIFEMFHQAPTEETRNLGGLGVGLTVARSLAELHGGGLRAESAGAGLGATFTLWLPRRSPPASVVDDFTETSPATVAADRALLRGRRVLIVEDSTDTREALERIFERRGCHVVAAATAAEGRALALGAPPDILLSDLGLPDASGLDLVRDLRARDGFRETIILALSGLGRESDLRAAAEAGFDAHLLKPVEIDLLDRTLADLLKKRAATGVPTAIR